MKNLLVLIIAVSTFLTGCSKFSQGLSYALDLQEIITAKYDSDEVQVSVKNDVLMITLIDTKFSGYSDLEKEEISREIGAIASGLDNKPQLSAGTVKFVTKGLNGIIKTSTTDSRELVLVN